MDRWSALVGAAIVMLPAEALAQERSYEWGWGRGMHPMGWMWGAWGISMMLGMLLFWGLVIAGIVLMVRWLVRQGGDGGERGRDRALEILRERYARGEINKEEFESRRRDLH